MTVPVPNVNQAYAMILNVEIQRKNGGGMGSSSSDTSVETTLMSNKM